MGLIQPTTSLLTALLIATIAHGSATKQLLSPVRNIKTKEKGGIKIPPLCLLATSIKK